MERTKNLNRYQKIILLLLTVMFVFFTITYIVVSSQKGFEYIGVIFQPHNENGDTIYSAQLHGEEASFTVTKNNAVIYRYGDKVCGPYTVKEDVTAIPENDEYAWDMIGIEIRQGEKIFFRGGIDVIDVENLHMYIDDENGNWIPRNDEVTQPSIETILELLAGPNLTSHGEWISWFLAVLASSMAVINILFADEIFYWHLSFSISYAYDTEPSDWEIMSRYILWITLTIMAFCMYVWGLFNKF